MARFPEPAGQFIAVHVRHHDVGYHQIDMLLLQKLQRFLAVRRRHRAVAVLLQHRSHQAAQLFIVLGDQNRNHSHALPFLPIITGQDERSINRTGPTGGPRLPR